MAEPFLPEPAPLDSPMTENKGAFGWATSAWHKWLSTVYETRLAVSPFRQAAVALTGQNDSIAVTSLLTLAAGVYRVGWRVRVSAVGAVSSSIQVTIGTTEHTIACTQSSTAYTGNVRTAPQSGFFLVHPDEGSTITYSTTYASNPANGMTYELDLVVEQLTL